MTIADLELTERDQVQSCDEWIIRHHYLHDASLVGEHMRYAANTIRQRFLSANGGRQRLHAPIFAKQPQFLDL
ncbi:MAG: hypothetical protein JNK85_21710 [Verrucomicrobiales bacterium]|nr:hypothetical protein [Verrucomicrobiales bacterium]